MVIFEKDQYLTEDRLYVVLVELFTKSCVKRQFKLGKYKVDFLVNEKLIIEFDGYRHYNSRKNQQRDMEVARLAKERKLEVMYVPYFIQYPYVCEALGFQGVDFGYKYPNGFIDSKALRPEDFNVQGLFNFIAQLNTYTSAVKEEILRTFNYEDQKCYNLVEDMFSSSDP